MCGPTAAELAASAVSAFPTVGAGGGVVVSAAGAAAGGGPTPPLGPLPRLVPPTGGSSVRRGASGGMIVMRDWWRSMRHAVVSASVITAPCSTRLAAHVSRAFAGETFLGLNSGQHLSQALRCLDEPRHSDGERDSEEAFAASDEPPPRQDHHACVLECLPLKRGRGEPPGEGHPEVHRRPSSFRLQRCPPPHGQYRLAPRPA